MQIDIEYHGRVFGNIAELSWAIDLDLGTMPSENCKFTVELNDIILFTDQFSSKNFGSVAGYLSIFQ